LTYAAGYIPKWLTCPQAFTHPSTNPTWRRVTSLIYATNATEAKKYARKYATIGAKGAYSPT